MNNDHALVGLIGAARMFESLVRLDHAIANIHPVMGQSLPGIRLARAGQDNDAKLEEVSKSFFSAVNEVRKELDNCPDQADLFAAAYFALQLIDELLPAITDHESKYAAQVHLKRLDGVIDKYDWPRAELPECLRALLLGVRSNTLIATTI
jgi:hypothetical protein